MAPVDVNTTVWNQQNASATENSVFLSRLLPLGDERANLNSNSSPLQSSPTPSSVFVDDLWRNQTGENVVDQPSNLFNFSTGTRFHDDSWDMPLFPPSFNPNNTPLSVPESDLVRVTDSYFYDDTSGGLLTSGRGADVSSLAWLIPLVLGVLAVMIILALLCYYGVRVLELKLTVCCQKNCACCFKNGEEGQGLTAHDSLRQTEMKYYRYSSASMPDD